MSNIPRMFSSLSKEPNMCCWCETLRRLSSWWRTFVLSIQSSVHQSIILPALYCNGVRKYKKNTLERSLVHHRRHTHHSHSHLGPVYSLQSSQKCRFRNGFLVKRRQNYSSKHWVTTAATVFSYFSDKASTWWRAHSITEHFPWPKHTPERHLKRLYSLKCTAVE